MAQPIYIEDIKTVENFDELKLNFTNSVSKIETVMKKANNYRKIVVMIGTLTIISISIVLTALVIVLIQQNLIYDFKSAVELAFYFLYWAHFKLYFKIVKGCNYGDISSCKNGGTCNSDGTCVCKNGFTGMTCSSCWLPLVFNKSRDIYFHIYYIVLGCGSAEYACENNGTCVDNINCVCQKGYTGIACSKCKILNFYYCQVI